MAWSKSVTIRDDGITAEVFGSRGEIAIMKDGRDFIMIGTGEDVGQLYVAIYDRDLGLVRSVNVKVGK